MQVDNFVDDEASDFELHVDRCIEEVMEWAITMYDLMPELALIGSFISPFSGNPDIYLPYNNGEHDGLLIYFTEHVELSDDQADSIAGFESSRPTGLPFNILSISGNDAGVGAINMIKEHLSVGRDKLAIH